MMKEVKELLDLVGEGETIQFTKGEFKELDKESFQAFNEEGFIQEGIKYIDITFGHSGMGFNFSKTKQELANKDVYAFEEEYSSFPCKLLENYWHFIHKNKYYK